MSHRTKPQDTDKMPSGIPYIVANEAAERFSFYGMKAILTVFMMQYLFGVAHELVPVDGELPKVDGVVVTPDGTPAGFSETTTRQWVHNFVAAVYFFPILGAILADALFGKYRIIVWLSCVYCLGHGALALMDFPEQTGVEAKTALWWGLTLVAIGSGGIKSCVTAHVGDQFGRRNAHLLTRVYGWFYFSINLGAAISTLLTPILLADPRFGPAWAFGLPGVLMALATFAFWMGRNEYAHVPPAGPSIFNDLKTPEGIGVLLKLTPMFIFMIAFWAIFDQTASTWVQQAMAMDRTVFGRELLPSQIQAVNPLLVMILIPLFGYVVYPFIERFTPVTPLRKIATGMVITVAAFLIPGWIEMQIVDGETPHISWQLLAYLVLTTAEILVSVTMYEFAYTQAPKSMKSFVMGLYLLSIFAGNILISKVNEFIEAGYLTLDGADYYWFFAGVMGVAAVGFIIWSQFYKEQTFLQDDDEAVTASSNPESPQ